jgi:hypothetical protein
LTTVPKQLEVAFACLLQGGPKLQAYMHCASSLAGMPYSLRPSGLAQTRQQHQKRRGVDRRGSPRTPEDGREDEHKAEVDEAPYALFDTE